MPKFQSIIVQGQAPCWYRVIRRGDVADALLALNCSDRAYIARYFKNPHMTAAYDKGELDAVLRHPVNALPAKAQTVLRYLKSEDVLLNRRGGWMTPLDSNVVVKEIEKDNEAFPAVDE